MLQGNPGKSWETAPKKSLTFQLYLGEHLPDSGINPRWEHPLASLAGWKPWPFPKVNQLKKCWKIQPAMLHCQLGQPIQSHKALAAVTHPCSSEASLHGHHCNRYIMCLVTAIMMLGLHNQRLSLCLICFLVSWMRVTHTHTLTSQYNRIR